MITCSANERVRCEQQGDNINYEQSPLSLDIVVVSKVPEEGAHCHDYYCNSTLMSTITELHTINSNHPPIRLRYIEVHIIYVI